MTTRSGAVIFSCVLLFTVSTAGVAEDSIVVDPSTGNYVITYQVKRNSNPIRVTFVPATKVDPYVNWSIKTRGKEDEVLRYRYQLTNGRASKQYLEGMRLSASNAIRNSAVSP